MADDDTRPTSPSDPFPNEAEVVTEYGATGYVAPIDGADENEDAKFIRVVTHNMAEGFRHEYENWARARRDVEFIYERQWNRETLAKRKRQNRPALTLNPLPSHVQLITGAMRETRFGIKAVRKSGLNGTVISTRGQRYSNAEAIGGIIRDTERRSIAHTQYMDAGQQAVESGFSHLQLKKVRPVDSPRQVELRIEHVQDRYGVIWDPFAKRPDKSDANWVSLSWGISRREYYDRYGDPEMDPGGVPHISGFDPGIGFSQWWTNRNRDDVRFIEYWWRKPMPDREMILMRDPATGRLLDLWVDEVEDVIDDLKRIGFAEEGTEQYDSHVIMGAQLTHKRVLTHPIRWEGNYLPVIPVYGRRVEHEGETKKFGLVRHVRDASRMVNYWATATTERVAMSPRDEYVVAEQTIEGNEHEFSTSGTPKGYRKYKHIAEVPPPKRELPPALPVAEINLVNLGMMFIRDITGIQQAARGQESNEVSGRAIRERKEGAFTSTYEFVDNLRVSIEQCGRLIADMAPKIMGRDHVQRLLLNNGTTAEVLLNHLVEDEETGKRQLVGALSLSRYDVEVTTGPAFATQREEMVAMLTELGKNMPDAMMPILDLYVAALDNPMGDEIARRLKHMVPRQMLTEEERAEIPEPQPTPAQQVEMAKAQAESDKAGAMAAKAQSDTEIAQVNLEEQRTRLNHRQLEIEQERLQLEQEKIQLERDKVKLEQAKVDAAAAERQAREERDIEKEAKRQAADQIDSKSLP